MLPYQDKNRPTPERVADLLGRMTLDEKMAQLKTLRDAAKQAATVKNGEDIEALGTIFTGWATSTEDIDTIQQYFTEKTRLGIPLLVARDSIHGFLAPTGTMFPQCAGMGGSFNPALVEQMAACTAAEARRCGVRNLYGPDIDVGNDPRWGRVQESYGEDPYLLGEMGAAVVRGFQKEGVAATAKHFIAYGVPEGGINLAPAHIGEREIRERMLEPYVKCIEAGTMMIMPSYNEIDGVPVHASKKWLRDVLRGELGFDGVLVNDYGAIEMMHSFQHTAKTPLEAGKLAIEAGVDIEALDPYGYGEEFKEGIRNGVVDEALVDEAVARILTLKFNLGLFEDPYSVKTPHTAEYTQGAIDLSRRLDEESILLLENDGILPLNEKTCGTVAIVGNNAKNTFSGDYIRHTKRFVDLYTGLVNRLGEDRVLYAAGCNPVSGTDEMIAEAVNVAKKADIVFLALGDSNWDVSFSIGGAFGGGSSSSRSECTCSEGYDMSDLNMIPSQRRLFDAIAALGKPMIMVMCAGRPYTVKEQVEQCRAFLFSWGGGEQVGNAFANLIFGDRSPSAKLTVSFPQSTGHIPCHYNHKPSARGFYKKPGSPERNGMDYVLSSPDPWYTFGDGLSYTTVDYSDLTVNANGYDVTVTVTVENTGNYDVDEAVLLFLKAYYTRTTPFVKRLRRFEKVHLNKGERKTVQFTLNKNDFTYVDIDYSTAYSDGTHAVMIGNLTCDFSVTGSSPVTLPSDTFKATTL